MSLRKLGSIAVVATMAAILPSSPVLGGEIPDPPDPAFSLFDGGWSPWDTSPFEVAPELGNATAAFVGLVGLYGLGACDESTDVVSNLTGSRYNFSFTINVWDCLLSAGSADVGTSSTPDFFPLGEFIWINLDGNGGPEVLSCLEAVVETESQGNTTGVIEFPETLFVESTSAMGDAFRALSGPIGIQSTSDRARDSWRDALGFVFYFGVEADQPPQTEADATWTIHVSVDRCHRHGDSTFLDHYFEKVTDSELPDTL